MTRLRLLGRHECELCEALYAVLLADPALASAGIIWLDLDDVPALRERYLYSIPVVLLDDDSEIWVGPADDTTTDTLKALLAA